MECELNSAICTRDANPIKTCTSNNVSINEDQTGVSSEGDSHAVYITQGDVLLQTADIVLKNRLTKKEMKIKALFDTASQRTYISDKVCKVLQFPVENHEFMNIKTFGSEKPISSKSGLVKVTAIGLDHKEIDFHALSFPTLCSSV